MSNSENQKDCQHLLISRITKFRNDHGDITCTTCGIQKDVTFFEWQKDRKALEKNVNFAEVESQRHQSN